MKGILNVRGKLATVIDLAEMLDLPAEESPKRDHIILAERGKDLFGVQVQSVTGVVRVAAAELKPAPDMLAAKAASTYLKGAIVIPGTTPRLLLVLDLPRILEAISAS